MSRWTRISLALIAACLAHLPAPDVLAQRPDLLRDQAVLTLPGMKSVQVDTGIVFHQAADRSLKLDFFRPTGAKKGQRSPVVIFVNGVGMDTPPLRRWGIYQSWGRLVAVSGMAAVTHDSRREHPREDLESLVAHLRASADRYAIDPDNIAIWACSANLRHGSWYALNPAHAHVKAAVFYYGNVDTTYLRTDLPILVGRAGLDNAALNAGLDGFVWRALRRNAPVTAFNVANGRHAFDAFDPEETSREAVRATLSFLRANLTAGMQDARRARSAHLATVNRHAAQDWEGTVTAANAWLEKEPEQAQARQLLGDAQYQLRHYREAAEAYEHAGEAGWYPFITLYNAGCAWALAGERDRALQNLEKAVGTGFFTDRRAIANDPDLVTLRDDPRFKKLVQSTP